MAMTGGAALDPKIQLFFTDLGVSSGEEESSQLLPSLHSTPVPCMVHSVEQIPIIEGYGLTETSPLVVSEKFAVGQN